MIHSFLETARRLFVYDISGNAPFFLSSFNVCFEPFVPRIYSVLALFPNFITYRGSSGGIVSDYGLGDRGSIPDRDRGFFF
jgi:hypothetical protein